MHHHVGFFLTVFVSYLAWQVCFIPCAASNSSVEYQAPLQVSSNLFFGAYLVGRKGNARGVALVPSPKGIEVYIVGSSPGGVTSPLNVTVPPGPPDWRVRATLVHYSISDGSVVNSTLPFINPPNRNITVERALAVLCLRTTKYLCSDSNKAGMVKL
jgi:hypothetical protein